jgi:hypothetical protein
MKKLFLKLAFVMPLFLLSSCADSGSYVKSIAYWHFGNLLQFLLIAAIAGLAYLVFTKIQSMDDTLKIISDQLQQQSSSSQQIVQHTAQSNAPVVQAPQPAVKTCPDCGSTLAPDANTCPSCGCPV